MDVGPLQTYLGQSLEKGILIGMGNTVTEM